MRNSTDASATVLQALLKRAAALAQAPRKLIGRAYRPEKHYMRGPGPKWRAKHTQAARARSAIPPRSDAAHGG